jgi:CheY-like chemotaxis protein
MESKKVLVVDDDRSVVEMLKDLLGVLGYTVDTAENETGLRKSLTQSKPDAILMDVNMPGMDGISLCRSLRLSPGTAHIPIIIITGFTDKETYNDAMLFGASGFIVKPFEVSEVQKKLEECLHKA